MRKPKFNDLHKNKKHAFIDGLLSGMLLVWLVRNYREDN